ncbi:MAG: hypothetical protein ABSF53_11270 [Terracidiphilus sp.]
MKNSFTVAACIMSFALALSSSGSAVGQSPASSFVEGSSSDEAAVRAIVASQSADKEDVHVAPDLDWENAFGIRYTNLKKRNDWFDKNIKPQFKDAQNTSLEVKVRFLEPTVAVADEYWRVVGQVYAGETKPAADRWGRTTYIFKKVNGAWTEVLERVADLRAGYFKHYESLPAGVPVESSVLSSYAGKYEKAPGKPYADISVAGDRLAITTHRGNFVGIPVSATEFLVFDPNDLADYFKLVFSPAPADASAIPKMTMNLNYADDAPLAKASKVP